jgi:hypothetical protein
MRRQPQQFSFMKNGLKGNHGRERGAGQSEAVQGVGGGGLMPSPPTKKTVFLLHLFKNCRTAK